MTFHSKVDLWLGVLLIAGAAAAFFGVLVATQVHIGWFLSAVVAVMACGFPLWVLFSTRYTVAEGHVMITSGPFSWRIPAQDITRVVPTHSPLSSPALSLDRLRIEYANGAKSLMVSPLHKEDFLRAVEAAKRM